MAQKDKVKELVGRGLNSYHTKTLQQIDRIEKKNKEQNHKISILTNELDNDYLTKTEEGSVVYLEHSKEGMVYLDELQGNTLVNYCTDGSKEMTLNGDIDVEGVSVTTAEGVDNGKVDVMCEGNTLVNLISKNWSHGTFETKNNRECLKIEKTLGNVQYVTNLKNGSTYTLIYDYISTELINGTTNPFGRLHLTLNYQGSWVYDIPVKNFESNKAQFTRSISVFTIPTDKQFTTLNVSGVLRDIDGTVWIDKEILLLEGDWSNKELPSYFEGMKSVGQDDENGHKIEILSQNKNLFNINETDVYSSGASCEKNDNSLRIIPTRTTSWASYNIKIKGFKNGETYTLSCISDNYHLPKSRIALYERATNINVGSWDRNYFTIPNNVNVEDIYLRIHCCDQDTTNIREVEISNILIEKGQTKTQFIPYAMNKKEILLNEPLRGLPSGVKDKKVKIGNKWYIERQCKQETFDGSSDEKWYVQNSNLENYSIFKIYVKNTPYASSGGRINHITDIINSEVPTWSNLLNIEKECTHLYGDKLLYVKISNSKLVTQDVDGFIKWLENNNINIVYELATPIYEPLEVEPTLNTHNDITHISNNSIIPCTMKIKNTGYNAIIKPSTLYTIALDTNKSGTIGMNLGGTKGTTTNNVLTLTTPATLTDDSLRLHGKGIKGSKVRLLEGDKTNCTPSFFEGVKSSFEDKFDSTDNTYKMEILSNNKNLLDVGESLTFDTKNIIINLKKGRYILDYKNVSGYQNGYKIVFAFYKGANKCITSKYLRKGEVIELTEDCDRIFLYSNDYNWSGSLEKFVTINTLQLSREEVIVGEPVTQKINKIQFSSIEPLRGVDNTKDKFVFKDGKLMIERNCGTGSLDGTASIYHCWTNNQNDIVSGYIYYNEHKPEITNIKQYSNVVCTDLPNNRGGHISTVEGFRNTAYFAFSIHKSKLGIEDINAGEVNQNILKRYFTEHPLNFVYQLEEPTYEEIPYELQKIILEGYENGTLFFDTNIPPTSTVTYAGETPIVKTTKLNKTEVLNNTNDINDNIIPYLMDMDYRVVCLQLESNIEGISMARLFGGTYEMLKRDIQSNRLSKEEYGYRLIDYLNAGKLTEEEVRELEDLR